MFFSTLTLQHQTTIPAAIRRVLALKAGDRLAYSVADGVVTLRKYVDLNPQGVYLDELLAAWDNPDDDDYNAL